MESKWLGSDSCIRIWICIRFFGLQSNNANVYDNALEFLENVLKSELQAVLVPLLDGKVSPKERAAIGGRLVRTRVENREQAVEELIASDNP